MSSTCAICNTLQSNDDFCVWVWGKPSIGLPPPPNDLAGSLICKPCYNTDGSTIEKRIRLNKFKNAMVTAMESIVNSSTIKQNICECGAIKCNTTHSTWCPVFAP